MQDNFISYIILFSSVILSSIGSFIVNFYWWNKVKKTYNQIKDEYLEYNFDKKGFYKIKRVNILTFAISLFVIIFITILKLTNLLNQAFLYETIAIFMIICQYILFVVLLVLTNQLIVIKTEKYLVLVNRIVELRSIFQIHITKHFIRVVYISVHSRKYRLWIYKKNDLDKWFETNFKELVKKG
ncbi:hypothetical protein MFERI13461_00613 [Mycoplasma feriruminatoris]|uniref:hypothetical protein n=1 Tax=Mycoplasma feriruminatoris TaxID=1179777 RepID=UPI00241D3344|nr:hypothetical protein [Mycoplasma feriruminatoris]WFQ91176.1 hypothetical protein MFERI13461_00613 [Mycoplasma feriruminatoris]